MPAKANGLIPMARVADVQRSIDFYKLMAMELRHSLKAPDGVLVWAHVACEGAELMFTRGDAVAADQQGVLFYLYTPDVIALRERLLAAGIEVSAITYPPYMPKGEICLNDPDGYSLLIGQGD